MTGGLDMARVNAVLGDVAQERQRQHAKWGDQSALPMGTDPAAYECLVAFAQERTERHTAAGTLTFGDILVEEFEEVMAEGDPVKLRGELVQLAAVAVQMVEALDRRNGSPVARELVARCFVCGWFALWAASAIGSWLIATSMGRPSAASMPVLAPPPPAKRSTMIPGALTRPALRSKHRLGLVTVQGVDYQIVDIGLRMLEPDELLRAQFGRFAEGYDLSAAKTKGAKVRLIGNSVCPEAAEALVLANFPRAQRRAA